MEVLLRCVCAARALSPPRLMKAPQIAKIQLISTRDEKDWSRETPGETRGPLPWPLASSSSLPHYDLILSRSLRSSSAQARAALVAGGSQQPPQQFAAAPAYGQAYASGGAPPPAAAYGSSGAPQWGAAGGYQGYGNPSQMYSGAGGGGPSSYGAPYGGSPPPYPPTAPVYAPGSLGGAYPHAQQPHLVYGKSANHTPNSLELGQGSPAPPIPDNEKITDQISVDIRHAFVRKVLGILAIQILVTFGVASAFGFIPALRSFLLAHYWLAIMGAVGAFVLQMVLVCVPNLARKVPTNFILMTLITLCYAVVLSWAAAASSRDAFLIAIGSTFVVVVAARTFSWPCSLVVGGKHRRYEYSIDDYIFAALTLYMDIIIIFMNILAIADNS
ncbi:hypothetical protein Esti_000284 [Eimeria stiedai]